MVAFNHTLGHFLDITGASIYFETAGNPEGDPLILLHGGLGCITDFNPILAQLPSRFKLIGIDFRGHGKSTLGDSRLSYARYQADVEAVLDHLGVHSYSILGFSDGGITGYRLALQSPSKVEKLIAVGAQWYLEPGSRSFSMLSGLESGMWIDMFPASVSYYETINPQPDFDRLVNAVVTQLWTDMTETGYPAEGVRRISAPVLLVRGDEDELLSLGEATELCHRLDEVHFLNVPFAGHEVHKEAPDIFMPAANAFLLR